MPKTIDFSAYNQERLANLSLRIITTEHKLPLLATIYQSVIPA